MKDYRHTQFGTVIAIVFLAVLPVAIVPALLAGRVGFWVLLGILGLLVPFWLLFYNLRVEIQGEQLGIRFGIGLIRKRFALDQIESCRAVKNNWLYGWGIRLTPHGWLYNVSGLEAVEVALKGGKKIRIGTDEPQVLAAALQERLEPAKTEE